MAEFIQSSAWGSLSLLFFFLFFVGVVAWVFRPGSKDQYQDASQIPLENDHE